VLKESNRPLGGSWKVLGVLRVNLSLGAGELGRIECDIIELMRVCPASVICNLFLKKAWILILRVISYLLLTLRLSFV